MALPNYYQPYGAYQNYSPIYQNSFQPIQQPVVTQATSPILQPSIQQNMPVINGKIVDGSEVVKSFDIPIGSYGVFPKADSSAVYIKKWTENGTTVIDEYEKVKPIEEIKNEKLNIDYSETLEEIYSSIKDLSKKIDDIKSTNIISSSTITKNKKVGDEDE